MPCLSLSIIPVAPPVLQVAPVSGASVSINPITPVGLSIKPMVSAQLTLQPSPQASVVVTPIDGIKLTIGEVCSIAGGEMTVLAASDGPLRTRDGGFILLDPARETG